MSETPSLYDLTQDALIAPMRDILLTAAEPPSGPEFSYPVVDQAVSSSMWRWITRGMGAGILGEGGQPYWYRNPSNATNTAQIAVSTISGEAHAMIAGFFHQLSESVTVQLPMPASGTETYHIALTYDPRRESDPAGPIKLETHTGSLPTTFDREHIPLVTVTRRANELLTDADVQQHRPFVSPTVTYNRVSELPPASTMLSGTVARTRTDGGLHMALRGNEVGEDGESATSRWVNVGDPAWVDLLDGTYVWAGSGSVPGAQKRGRRVTLRGAVRIRNGNNFNTGQNSGNGYRVMALPARFQPARFQTFITGVSGNSNIGHAKVIVNSDGDVRVYVSQPAQTVYLDGIEFDVA